VIRVNSGKELGNSLKAHMTDVLLAPEVGIASVDRFSEAPAGWRPQELLPGAQSVIVFILPVLRANLNLKGIMEQLRALPDRVEAKPFGPGVGEWQRQTSTEVHNPRQHYYTHFYGRTCYETQNAEEERIAYQTALWLERKGYEALILSVASGATFFPPPSPPTYGSIFSFRHAAVAAGLGELGMNNIFMTPEWGPRVRLGALITAAPLQPDPVTKGILCLGESCMLCVKGCPAQAFGPPFNLYDLTIAGKTMRLAKVDKSKCANRTVICSGECHNLCPIGKTKKTSDQ
jgi:hypothetical protein